MTADLTTEDTPSTCHSPAITRAPPAVIAEEFYGGGTDFETPLSEAMDDVRTAQFKKADIVMVTDGICETSEAFEKEFHDLKEKTGVRLHTVVIGEHSESLERLSDTYSPLYDLLSQGDAAAGKLFESV